MTATEADTIAHALRIVDETESKLPLLLSRLGPFLQLAPGAAILDVGAAQGATVIAFRRAGYQAHGIEPWPQALVTGKELARLTETDYALVPGWAESLPFEANRFDYVQAYSVLEHVKDPIASVKEAFRVLRPGGAFRFFTTSSLCPLQNEIRGFPLFPWYPGPAQRAIMYWAAAKRPSLIGGTTQPALHWFRHRSIRQQLSQVGFRQVVDRWTVRALSRERTGWKQGVIELTSRHRPIRMVGDLLLEGMEYLAIK